MATIRTTASTSGSLLAIAVGLASCHNLASTGLAPVDPPLDRLLRVAAPVMPGRCQKGAGSPLSICEHSLPGGMSLFAVRTSAGPLSSVSYSTKPASGQDASRALDSVATTLRAEFGKPRRCGGFLQWRVGTAIIEADVRSAEDVPQTSRPAFLRVYVEGNELGQGRPC